MDFYSIDTVVKNSNNRSSDIVVEPSFYYNSEDAIFKGGSLYAYWDGQIWNTDISELFNKIDKDVRNERMKVADKRPDDLVTGRYMNKHKSGMMDSFKRFEKNHVGSDVVFNKRIIFSDDPVRKEDYATWRLSYTPEVGDTDAFDELMEKLYDEEELEKILWFIGALLDNEMRNIQKFMYLYGGKGTGKGTTIKIMKKIFEGYFDFTDLSLLTSNSEFATAQIKEIPLLLDEDADINSIQNDTRLLKVTAHEPVEVNKKYQRPYMAEFQGLIVAASNQRYKVRNVDSGITRRAVVIEPTGKKHTSKDYKRLMEKVDFEIPHIAKKCIDFFRSKGAFYYEEYVDVEMMQATDHIFDFMRQNHKVLGDEVSLKKAAELYKIHLEDIGFDTKGYKRKIKEELKRYYHNYYDRISIDGKQFYNLYTGIKEDLIFPEKVDHTEIDTDEDLIQYFGLHSENESIFDKVGKDYPAQLATEGGTPKVKWSECETTLSDISTRELHYVRVPMNHIVVDFDIKNSDGKKDLYLNMKEAAKFPETYTETSKSGQGLHLHYIYEGDVSRLAYLIKEDVEIKVFNGLSSLRRKLTMCNAKDISHISSGLPLKEEDQVRKESKDIMWTEKKLRTAVEKNLRKEYHAATKPSVDFIAHLLNNAAEDGVEFDLTDMRSDVMAFATQSSNQAKHCIGVVKDITWSTIEDDEDGQTDISGGPEDYRIVPDEELYFFDIEVFPNLLIVAFKKKGEPCELWYNPDEKKIEWLLDKPLVGFNNRRYDNHILYAALLGKSNNDIFRQSMRIIDNDRSGSYGNAYGLSYADIYEYNSTKQSLKKWEVEMGIKHDEFEHPWDQPLEESLWERAGQYCINDVEATEKLFEETYYDYNARTILATISGLPVNSTTQNHAAKIIFGDDPRPQEKFEYVDLSEEFPGYKYSYGKSEYKGEDPSEGGYVHSEPGIYHDVGVLDVRSMHPYSLINLNHFGPYTKNFKDLVELRVAIKEGNYEKARKMYGGRLNRYLEDEKQAKDLAYALKIIINIVYGMTSAKFDNKFRHPDNDDNIVAKRGALFMIDLKNAVQEKGYTVAHIKTDSIKIPDMDDEIKKFVFEFGEKYGYIFEHEATYEKMALVNKAVLVSKYGWAEDESKIGKWDAVGAQFAEPYVFKKLFSKEDISDDDFAVTKQTTAPIYIDDKFIGKIAQVYASKTGGEMRRVDEDKESAVTGTKGYSWRLMSEYRGKEDVDMDYYEDLVEKALENIDKVGQVHMIVEDLPDSYGDKYLPF